MIATNFKCPSCGADLKDWRSFSAKDEIDQIKPFECVGFRCGKRWEEQEILQEQKMNEGWEV